MVLSLLQLFTVGVWDLVALRLALGLAIGVEYAVGTAALAEFSRKKGRGVLLGNFAVWWMIGFVAAFMVGLLWSRDNWRLLLATSAVPAFIVFVLRSRLPESPMWLKARGRDDEAEAIVLKHYGEGYAVAQVKLDQKNAELSDLFTRQTWRPHLYSGLFWFCQVGPFFAIFTFLTPVFNGLGITDAFTVETWLNVVQFAGAVFGLYLLQRLTRRGFVNWTFALMFLTLLALGLFGDAPLWLTVGLFAFYLFMAPGANNIQYVHPSEIFDTRVRGTGVGFSAAFSRISAAGATYVFPLFLAELGTSATLLLVSAFPLLGLILSILWAPETKEKTLRRGGGPEARKEED